MHAGLLRILDLIRVNPQDTLLVDRFLILSSDLKQDERAIATLSLSEALLRKNPRRAIELAHMVYKATPGETEPLELMVEGLENLGRYGKATVLRQHLENLKQARQTNPGMIKKAVDDSVIAVDRELLQMEQSVSPEVKEIPSKTPKSLASFDLPSSSMFNVRPPVPDHLIADPQPASLKRTTRSDVVPKAPAKLNLEPPAAVKNDFFAEEKNRIPSISIDLSQEFAASAQKPLPSEALPEISKGVPAYRSRQGSDGIPSLFTETDDSRWREPSSSQDESAEERPAQPPRQEPIRSADATSHQQTLEDFKYLMASQDWEGLWTLIQLYWKFGGTGEVVDLAKKAKLYQVDLRFVGWWLDSLMIDRRPREAFALATKILREQPHIAVAKVLYPRFAKCARVLGFRDLEWSEASGVLSLLKLVKDENIGTAAAIAIFNPRLKFPLKRRA